MSEFTLKSGKTVTIDVSGLTTREWRHWLEKGTSKEEDRIISKCTGLTAEEILDMPAQESLAVVRAIVKAVREPLSTDPS